MMNRKFIVWIMFAMLFPVSLSSCSDAENIEQVVEETPPPVKEPTPVIEAASEEVPKTEEEIAPAIEEAIKEIETDYDPDLYGMIDEIDLNGAQVTFWTRYTDNDRKKAMDAICDDFNDNNVYGITIECLPIGNFGILYDKMIAGLTTGDVPGLVVAHQSQAAAYQNANGLVNIEPYMNHPVYGLSEEETADLFQLFIESDRLPQHDSQIFGFPAAGRSMELLFINLDWAAELGYDTLPQTPEAFAAMACAAAQQPFSKNESAFTIGMEVYTGASTFASWVFARGGDIYNPESGKFTYNTPEAIESMTLLQKLYVDGCVIQITAPNGDQTDFSNGKTLFTTSPSSSLPNYASAIHNSVIGDFNWTVAPIPFTGDAPVQNIYGPSVSIVRTDPQTQLASWLFLKHWVATDNQAKWVEASNYFPARASVTTELSGYMKENIAFGTAFDLLQYGKAEAPVAGYDNVRDLVKETMIAIVFDGADVVDSLAALDAQANKILEETAP